MLNNNNNKTDTKENSAGPISRFSKTTVIEMKTVVVYGAETGYNRFVGGIRIFRNANIW